MNERCDCGHVVNPTAKCMRCGMEPKERNSMRFVDLLIKLGSIVAPYDADGSQRKALLADAEKLRRRGLV